MKKLILATFTASLLLISCNNDDEVIVLPEVVAPEEPGLKLNLTGLENLGPDYKYEGWLVVGGTPVSTGIFTVDNNGVLSKTLFTVDPTTLSTATTFVLSIEPTIDPSTAPSDTKYLVADFSGNTAAISANIIGDFNTATGKYFLGTPTDGNMNPSAGVWFLDDTSGSALAGLNLPVLDAGWKYEGWVVSNGVPVSTGRFSDPNVSDDAAPFSGSMAATSFPGEDFLTNAPAGVTFPGNLSGATLVISIEPEPDNSPMPFALKPLSASIANPAVTGTTLPMMRSLTSFPSGTVTR